MTGLGWMRLGDLVPTVLAGWEKKMDSPLQGIRSAWETAVGPLIAAHACPLALRQGVLLISVDSPVWRAELAGFQGERIRGALNDSMGTEQIRKLRFITRPRAPAPSAGEETHAEAEGQV